MANREHIPAAKKAAYLDKQMFATIMCMIPAGKLITQEAICEMWARRKGANFCEIKGDGIMPFDKKLFWNPPMFSGWILSQNSKTTASPTRIA